MNPSLRSDPDQPANGEGLWKVPICGKPTAHHPVFRSSWKTPTGPPPAFPTPATGPTTTR